MYERLARTEESEMLKQFGEEYSKYAVRTPRYIPRVFDGERNPA
jgi:protein-S-isoprenylcysteine O-methyltransferase Ste14